MYACLRRELVAEYNEEVLKLCGRLMKIFSVNLGLDEDYLENAFGGDEIGASLRVNFYPKCAQPDLTLAISPHSDPGEPIPNAFIINLADQLQVLISPAEMKSESRWPSSTTQEEIFQ
ncbi:probable 2-oxoglutarate-dependent dioxygenase [Tanacetum coccineum]